MKIIAPVRITPPQMVSSSIPETDHPEWSSGTAYTAGERVIVAAEHKVYEAQSGNVGKAPATNPDAWLDLGATNRWRAFDEKVGSVTSALGQIAYTLTPGIVNALALLNIGNASTVRVRMIDAAEGVVYDRAWSLYDPANVIDWWTYFFEPIRLKTISIALDLPTYRAAQLEVTLQGGPAETVSLGACIVGRLHEYVALGGTQMGASIGIQDYSRKERDAWGNVAIVERAFSKRARWSLMLDAGDVDVLQERLAALRATPAVYIGSERYASTVLYGFFRDFDVVIAYPDYSECVIEIEGLV